jgi:hypothetical protein
MGWSDSHLHRFRIYGKDFGVYHMGGPIFDDNPKEIRLADFLSVFLYQVLTQV